MEFQMNSPEQSGRMEVLGAEVESGSQGAIAPFIVKFSRKSRLARLHLMDGCANARDTRIGIPVFELGESAECAYNAVCRKCWPRGTGPLENVAGQGDQVPSSGSSSESESSSSDAAVIN